MISPKNPIVVLNEMVRKGAGNDDAFITRGIAG